MRSYARIHLATCTSETPTRTTGLRQFGGVYSKVSQKKRQKAQKGVPKKTLRQKAKNRESLKKRYGQSDSKKESLKKTPRRSGGSVTGKSAKICGAGGAAEEKNRKPAAPQALQQRKMKNLRRRRRRVGENSEVVARQAQQI